MGVTYLQGAPRPIGRRSVPRRLRSARGAYLLGAACIVLSTLMVMPIVVSVLASLKTTAEAAAVPPTYVPNVFSLDSYTRLWTYQAGLLHYLVNSLGTAFLTIA